MIFVSNRRSGFWLFCWLVTALLGGPGEAMPFTYQGRLVDGGVLANGTYQLRFRLFDQLAAGNQVGGDLSESAVTVTNGVFTVLLDFGPGVFNGAARWLELGARPAGSAEALAVFDPRQPVTAVPYALFALTGSGDASALTTGTLADARLSRNIVRAADLLSLSNSLSARLERLDAMLLAVSNQFRTLLLPGITVASADAADAGLMAQGLARFLAVEAPGWRNGAAANMPAARSGHSALWTGESLLVWGGSLGGAAISGSGGSYDPALDQWSPLSTLDPPAARTGHSAVWTGRTMIVWGGFGGSYLNTGAEYFPVSPSWSAVATLNAPAPREGHSAVWTGARMVVWGGRNATGLLRDGAAYDPGAKQWSALPPVGAPQARLGGTAIWTGTQFIVWGGTGPSGALGTGAFLPLAGGVTPGLWAAMSAVKAPSARSGHTAVWTGTKLLIWGGQNGGIPLGDGAAFDPAGNTWEPLPATGAPTPRADAMTAWTGDELLIFGGETSGGTEASGAAFRPATGTWRPLPGAGSPMARSAGVSAWTGSELLVFGGLASGSPLAALQRLNPQPTWYLYRKP